MQESGHRGRHKFRPNADAYYANQPAPRTVIPLRKKHDHIADVAPNGLPRVGSSQIFRPRVRPTTEDRIKLAGKDCVVYKHTTIREFPVIVQFTGGMRIGVHPSDLEPIALPQEDVKPEASRRMQIIIDLDLRNMDARVTINGVRQ